MNAQSCHIGNQLVVHEVNKEMTRPIGKLRGPRNHYLMLNIRLPFLDQALNDLICHHHIRHCESHSCNHALPRIDIRLNLKTKW